MNNLAVVARLPLDIHVERLARQAALRELLDTWDREVGPVPESEQVAARAAFDELDA